MRYVNNNPTKKKTGDCVVRAIAGATEQTWEEVYDALVAIGRELHEMPNAQSVYEEHLKRLGYKRNTIPKTKLGEKRLKAKDLAKTTDAIIRQANHVCYSKDGHVHDSWSSEERTVYTYYTK